MTNAEAAESLEHMLECARSKKSCRVDEEALRIAIRELRKEHEA